jgi:beta-lactamase regulating signal transducer with metallopeptidase domain
MSFWEGLSALVRAVLAMSAAGGAAVLVLFALQPLLRRGTTRLGLYRLWIAALAAFLLPLSVLVTVPFSTPAAPLQTALEENIQTTAEFLDGQAWQQYGKSYSDLDPTEQSALLDRFGPIRGSFRDFFMGALLTVGLSYFLLALGRYGRYAAALRRSRLAPSAAEVAALAALCPGRQPRLYRSPLAEAPMVAGLLHPAIYLPHRDYTPEQLSHILRHELCHWRRGDVGIKWCASLAVCLHWFNPLVYLLRRELDRSCELACDEAALRGLDAAGRQAYGETLLALSAGTGLRRSLHSTTLCEEKRSLKVRLGAILAGQRETRGRRIFSAGLLAAAVCGILLLGAASGSGGWDPVQEARDAQLLAALENPVPEGLTLELTAARDDGEFSLRNASTYTVEYGGANRVERREADTWVPVLGSRDIFPEAPEPLRSGERLYGMTAWSRDGTVLSPGQYRYLMLVLVWEDGERRPVVLSAEFTIPE